jgi:hypothetical protein
MRTTIAIPDNLHALARAEARKQGVTLGEFVEESIRRASSVQNRPRVPVTLHAAGEGGMYPWINPHSNQSMVKAADSHEPEESPA